LEQKGAATADPEKGAAPIDKMSVLFELLQTNEEICEQNLEPVRQRLITVDASTPNANGSSTSGEPEKILHPSQQSAGAPGLTTRPGLSVACPRLYSPSLHQ